MNPYGTGRLLTLVTMLVVAVPTCAQTDASNIDINPFKNNIAEVERESGALDHRLAEQYLGMGLALQANGNFAEAIAAFQQALHINRINTGLHHLVHLPIIDLLVDAHAERGDWTDVDQYERLRYWMVRRELDLNAPEYAHAAMRFASWQSKAFRLDTGAPTLSKLRAALRALEAAHSSAEASASGNNSQLIAVLNAQAQAYLNLAVFMNDPDEDGEPGGHRPGEDFGDVIERRNVIIESFIRGKAALDNVIVLTASETNTVQHALALANLADWELVFDRPQSSTKNYRLAFAEFSAARPNASDVDNEFGRPRQLSYFTINPRPIKTDEAPSGDKATVVASFHVTKSGTVRNIEIVSAVPPENRRIRRRARSTLRASRFRPSINANGPIAGTTTIRYVFPDIPI